jgi:single-stranded-DNA-specific exonuclease
MSLRGTKHSWTYEPADPGLLEEIRRETGVSPVFAQVLASRGVPSGDVARHYLTADASSLPDAHLLPDAALVVERIGRALQAGETIAVHGHDDADGVTAATIMIEALAQLGAKVRSYVPDRRVEGHGLSRGEFDLLAGSGVSLVVTVDSCVSDRDAIAYGNGLGLDTIVTDHHEIPPELPPAVAIVNPKLPHTLFPYRYMAGVGVSLRLAEILLEDLSGRFGPAVEDRPWFGPRWRGEILALAAIGSLADKVPLTFDNRTIVTAGLAAIPGTERPGLRALLEESQLWGRAVDEDDIRESMGPAFGRVSDGRGNNDALDLLLTQNLDDARSRARALLSGKETWRNLASAAWRKVKEEIRAEGSATEAQVRIVSAEIPIAVMGYVASRLSDQTRLPVILLAPKNAEWMAEARSQAGFNLVEAFHSMSDLFLGYGGHPRAAGFTIDPASVEAFGERMLEFVRLNPPSPPPRSIDAELRLTEATPAIADELATLRPFGQGNPRAVLVSRGATAREYEAARAQGLRFSTPPVFGKSPLDVVYRLRRHGSTATASVVDTIDHASSSGASVGS